MSFICMRKKIIFMSMASHLASLCWSSPLFFSGYSGFPLLPKTNTSKFQFDLGRSATFKRVHTCSYRGLGQLGSYCPCFFLEQKPCLVPSSFLGFSTVVTMQEAFPCTFAFLKIALPTLFSYIKNVRQVRLLCFQGLLF